MVDLSKEIDVLVKVPENMGSIICNKKPNGKLVTRLLGLDTQLF